MKTLFFNGKVFAVDDQDFLIDPSTWDDDFAKGIADKLNMSEGLTAKHWEVIHFIRNDFARTGVSPVVHKTCKSLGLNYRDLQKLFPTGYQRGACLISGISYKYGWLFHNEEPGGTASEETLLKNNAAPMIDKVYRVDLFGYLVDPLEWDTAFADRRAFEMGLPKLSEKHWRIIHYLRKYYFKNQTIPTIYQCCEENELEIEEMEKLFPSGYHRGPIKIAGLPILAKYKS